MQIEQLTQGIQAKFNQSRLVFWYDPELSFQEELSQLSLDDTVILDMGQESVLEVKKRIELDQPEQPFLLYFPYIEPESERDWMLDIRLYSEQFYADHSSMLLAELGIGRMALRAHIHQRQRFFASKQRLASLKKWVTENEDEVSLDRKMIAVVVKADSASITDSLLSLLNQYANHFGNASAGVELPLMTELVKYNLDKAFWSLLTEHFSYDHVEPTFADFVLKLFCTDLWNHIDADDRDWLLNNVLKTASGRATALAFMTSWRDSRHFSEGYSQISHALSRQLEVDRKCTHYHPVKLKACETFETIEQIIIRGLVHELLDSSQKSDRIAFDGIVTHRLGCHWSHPTSPNGKEYNALYHAIHHAERLFYLRTQYVDGFHYDSAIVMYKAYEKELFQFDQSYRLFNEHVHAVQSKGADILRQLDDEVESLYTQWYLHELGLAWDRHISNESLLESWRFFDTPQQANFFDRSVQKYIKSKTIKRVFVIISDAFRYEIAQELTLLINGEKRFKAELHSQLGVLPSYTQLGMASLLPHQRVSYSDGQNATVYVDGQSTQGLDNRQAILQKIKGLAVKSTDLMKWSNQEGRDTIRDAEVVYIYHDTIDAIGDKLATEEKTFEACRTAINELKDLIARVMNRLNGSRVLLTADHGFLFQQKALEATDKTALTSKPVGTIEAKKRYIIGDNLPSDEACWKGKISNTAHGEGSTEFLLPKGAQRFHFIGGARFVHGGAMLQEICVPVMQMTLLRGAKVAQHEKQPVGVVVAKQPIKIVNNIDKIHFIQSDPVDDRFIPRQLDVVIVDANNREVSSRETINFNSSSKVMDERSREARFKLIGSDFDRNATYTLILENTDTQTRYNQYAVTIDLAFQDDFF
jgi:uncharacterized protein (TIGR02687 family)